MTNKELFQMERNAYNEVKKAHENYSQCPSNSNYNAMVKADNQLHTIRNMMK